MVSPHVKVEIIRSVVNTGDLAVIERLVYIGAAVNDVNVNEVALIFAAQARHLPSVRLLMERGCGDTAGRLAQEAVQRRDQEQLEFLLRAGAPCESALITAASMGHVRCMELIIQTGADVNLNSALVQPAVYLQVECVEVLIRSGADVNVLFHQDKSLILIRAASLGYMNCARMMIEAGADVNIADAIGETCVMKTARNGFEECLNLLIKAGACVNMTNFTGMTALGWASQGGHYQCVQLLLEAGADVKFMDSGLPETALLYATKHAHCKCVTLLIDAGADVNIADTCTGTTALMNATINNDTMCLDLLLHTGADVNMVDRYNESALVKAIKLCYSDCTESLVKAGAYVNVIISNLQRYNNVSMTQSVILGDEKFAEQLAYAGAVVSKVTTNDQTALSVAVHRGDYDLVKLLTSAGADMNDGCLAHVAEIGNCEMLEVLLQTGADVNQVYANDETALIISVWEGHHRCAELLLQAGADVNSISVFCETPLIGAVHHGNIKLVKMLLKAGACINQLNNQGQNARTYNLAQCQPPDRDIENLLTVAGEPCLAMRFPSSKTFVERYDENGDVCFVEVVFKNKNKRKLRSLLKTCKSAIRDEVKRVNPYMNLFMAAPQLGLPRPLASYLLNYISLNQD